MKWLAVTQRVEVHAEIQERRDALDQRWSAFLYQAGFLPLLLPNQLELAMEMLTTHPVQGLLLTGGNSLQRYGGDAPERDALEFALLQKAEEKRLPVLGVCRGMQVMQAALGVELVPLSGHVQAEQEVCFRGEWIQVNSYHQWGTSSDSGPCESLAHSHDGVIKALRHHELPWWGIMWHPERLSPFRAGDLQFFQEVFSRCAQ
ncbi:hypothetical protein COW36_03305 [bacterium (Candidatus Blackallbacteria) CG17_big_fil_post_rev_8_21_14_2_50_48_46]|uniref:Uncharacterized protein n=1 Tax=bacterium (Candidatus Blackallbacteria) CG17_big_fil_post_rev_8_21_14_2_50_48_46 TaxID=2014261 RepID=A0A2M7GAA2_9BACT|nr:MAG: hypothetical protein COW64_05545 [bacterium (Candidatus Blackallbacteria) CG18_big_fil_WC_8_21_14_2_50_49_26]PIW18818.1 MAG: hypothetical protein COW36_03305 [bacterium (Candidatus Blackallbacteria) CG17_big_fil_post_rev_8_21_14_2_50_48_46]PIW49273.1 MAG: hypothetical protein COW20_06455 [bacterium (Candidatus Blackallbacteria) CG13_big_fil_rev_8_21_14_2_50_49_14]